MSGINISYVGMTKQSDPTITLSVSTDWIQPNPIVLDLNYICAEPKSDLKSETR